MVVVVVWYGSDGEVVLMEVCWCGGVEMEVWWLW